MAALSFSPPPPGPPSKRLRIGSAQKDVGRCLRERPLDRTRHPHAALIVEQHLELWRCDEGIARSGQHLGRQGDLLQPLAQIVILNLGLQIEDPQRPWWGKAKKLHTCGHMDEPADQKIALAYLGRAAQHQQPARCQNARRYDVLRHRALVFQQRAEREGGHLLRARCDGVQPDQRRSVLLDMPVPEPLGLALQPFDWPLRAQQCGIVAADAFPTLAFCHPVLVDHADEVADRGRCALETGPIVLRTLAHRREQHIVHGGLVGMRELGLQWDARCGRHVGHGLDELGQITLAGGVHLDNPHLRPEAVLVIDAARHPDRLVGRAEMHVAADLGRDVAAQTGRQTRRMSSPSAGSVSARQNMGLACPSGVTPPLSTTIVGDPRCRSRWARLATISPVSSV